MGPTVGELAGFLGPVIEEAAKNEGFMNKSIEHLQCHDIQHIDMAVWLKILDTHFGMVPSGRISQFRASSWGSHTGNSPRKTLKELDQT